MNAPLTRLGIRAISLPFSLQDCTAGTEILAKWKALLENDRLLSHSAQDLGSDAFHR